MDAIAAWSADRREELFRDAAERHPLVRSASLIEKDFWVCWMLRRLFGLENRIGMIFKGGTSLSKAYGAIRRFSEDIDVSLSREALGFRVDPGDTSRKAFQRQLDDLARACVSHVADDLGSALAVDIESRLGPERDSGWRLATAGDADDDATTLVFSYPATEATLGVSGYAAPSVRLEFGARGDTWPTKTRDITPYAAEVFPDEFTMARFEVLTLDIARTFWEKATILHAHANGGVERIRPRLARHYYDLIMLAEASVSAEAVSRLDLLEAVALHKSRFFPAAWASYETARPGSLRLVPPPDVQKLLERDYREMEVLFMEPPPRFRELMARLATIEARVNGES